MSTLQIGKLRFIVVSSLAQGRVSIEPGLELCYFFPFEMKEINLMEDLKHK